jgi:hypothetical protein
MRALAARDPETLLGPALWLLTRLARGEGDLELAHALVAHCTALAAHPSLSPRLRIAAGGIAIEQRQRTAMLRSG